MLLGFALTQHCNLRCPHCIRDDVTTVYSLDADLIGSILDDALALFGDVTVSLTGGEPLLHPHFKSIIERFSTKRVPYRLVSNGWHLRRIMPTLDRWPAEAVRLSLSGATAAVHDAERGRGSFRRVLLGVALLTSRRIPTALSLVIDRRDRHQVREAATLAEALGCTRIHFILPQPVPGSAARNSDLPPEEWWSVRREVEALAGEPGRATAIQLDYGAPLDADGPRCDTFALRRVYVDARGRLSTCCQLSEYGFNERDVVADLSVIRLRDAWPRYVKQLQAQEAASRRSRWDVLGAFPCLRCARSLGKLAWIASYPESPWAEATQAGDLNAVMT